MGVELGTTDKTEEVRILTDTIAKIGVEGGDKTATAYAALMVEFLLKQDDASQKWLAFLVTIQAALATAFYFSLKLDPELATKLPWISYALPFVIGLFGAVTPQVLIEIATGQRKWFIWYSHQFAKLAGIESSIYGDLVLTATNPSEVSIGRQGKGYWLMAWSMSICWSLLLIATLLQ